MSGFAITGWGIGAPGRVVTNAELEATLDTSDEWIRSRSGIAERRWAGPGESTAELVAEATRRALKVADRSAEDIGLLVVATCTPDQVMPPTAAAVSELLGARSGSFDLNGACAGFVDALVAAAGLVGSAPGPVVVAGGDRMSAIVDPTDRTTAVLFGDGAGALILEPGDGELLAWDGGTDGALRSILEIPAEGRFIEMDGGEVFRRAIRVVHTSIANTLQRAEVASTDVALFVPHQANIRIIDAITDRAGLDPGCVVSNVDRWGNTSAGSIPIALTEAIEAGRVRPGDLVLVAGFGAGMSWATALLRWA